MHWSMYEVFSVLSGVILMGVAFSDLFSGFARVKVFFGGAAFAGYGVFVAKQDTGTFEFPFVIFLIPAGALLYVLYLVVRGAQGPSPTDGRTPRGRDD